MTHATPEPAATSSPAERHIPVLLERCIDLLTPAIDAARAAGDTPVIVDATLGMGGHSHALLQRFDDVRVIGLDRDPQALAMARARVAEFGARFTGVHAVFNQITDVLASLAIPNVHGVLFDLGVSSFQLDEVERGFAYSVDAPLDMRMDPTTGITAAEIVNTYSERDLARILRVYGEERFASRIASAIVRERQQKPFTTSARLVDIVRTAIPAATRRTGGHPAKRTFQALRIEVNQELDVLRTALPAAMDAVVVGGRIVVMSFQSLEDRIVKDIFVAAATSTAPADLPVVPEAMAPHFRLVRSGAEQASDAEIAANPRAASVRLRAIERIRSAA